MSKIFFVVFVSFVAVAVAACAGNRAPAVSEPPTAPAPTMPAPAAPAATPIAATTSEPAVTAAAPPPAAAVAGMVEVHVKVSEFKFELDKTSVPAGPVKFIVENTGKLKHNFILEAPSAVDEPFTANGKTAQIEDVEPGKTETLEWVFDKPGKVQIGCHIDVLDGGINHDEKGEFAELEVTQP